MRKTVITIAAVSALFLTGCGGASSSTLEADCLEVPDKVVASISGDLKEAGFKPAEAAAVKADKDVWAVAIKYTGKGDPITPVFATTSLDGSGLTMAADGFAKEYTSWPTAEPVGLDASSDAVQSAQGCV